MAYTDPRVTYEFSGLTAGGVASTSVAVDATAAILAKNGRIFDETDDASAADDKVHCPAGATIDAFGCTVTTALSGTTTTKAVFALKVIDIEGGTTTTVATLSLPKTSADVTPGNVSGGQVLPNTATAAQAVAVGARFISSDTDLPYTVPQGGAFYVEQTVAAAGGSPAGAVKVWVIARQNGLPAAIAASPVTKLAS